MIVIFYVGQNYYVKEVWNERLSLPSTSFFTFLLPYAFIRKQQHFKRSFFLFEETSFLHTFTIHVFALRYFFPSR